MILICKRCNTKMIHYTHFSKERQYEAYRCPVCGNESIKLPVEFHDEKVKQKKYIKKKG